MTGSDATKIFDPVPRFLTVFRDVGVFILLGFMFAPVFSVLKGGLKMIFCLAQVVIFQSFLS
jgi:hypothetical protein